MAGDAKRGPAIRQRRGKLIAPTGLAQMRALGHPLRLRLLELFAKRARTTKQAAETMRVAPTRLYHHVATLERAGLVRLGRTRRVRGATEKYYELAPAQAASAEAALNTPAGRRETAALGVLLFEEARRDLVAALAHCAPGTTGDILAVRGVLGLTPAGHARLRAALLGLLRGRARKRRGAPASKLRRWSLTISLVPTDGPDDEGGTPA